MRDRFFGLNAPRTRTHQRLDLLPKYVTTHQFWVIFPKLEPSGSVTPAGQGGGWTWKLPFSPKLIYFSHMSSPKFRPLRGAWDLWKSCLKWEAESIKHFIQRCLRANTAENMSYHILKSGILRFLLETCFSAKTKVVQLVKPNNSLGYSFTRFPQKTWLTIFDGFCSNLDIRIS